MKTALAVAACCAAVVTIALPGKKPQANANRPAASPVAQVGTLEFVLNRMDTTAASFRSADADFIWVLYEKVVDSTDTQKGHIYFRRSNKKIQMAAEIIDPEAERKQVVYDGNKLQLYQPKIDQITQYDTSKNRDAVESFLVLGFGGSGHDLLKSFNVKFLGTEKVIDVEAAKLDLIPKTQKGQNIFNHILLWIDPARGVSVQQQFFEPSGNYRLAKYSNIRLNQRIPDNVFKVKTTSRTKVINPQGGGGS